MLRGTPGLREPLRDVQEDAPVCCCQQCGGAVYSGETMFVWEGKKVCSDCFKAYIAAWVDNSPEAVADELMVETEMVFFA